MHDCQCGHVLQYFVVRIGKWDDEDRGLISASEELVSMYNLER